MYDLQFHLMNRPGTLAELGEAMGRAGVPFEGGGVFSNGDQASAHFLFLDGEAAARAAAEAGIPVIAIRKPLIRRLKQGTPGQLGAISRALAEAGVNVLVQYSDHHNRLVLICDQEDVARRVTEEWSVGDDLPIEAQ
ncbi:MULTISPECIES: amino acid-binding ACT domain-containing protein [unclassified Brucella]|uniref:amino acid-binding ACT domain-containing protein n=1 Tax=unclassified Brucella TaxID=2632610 RepID=UPI0012AD9EFF|nr:MULTISPECIES: amino acid-binding ACT domain-containing protein [unclassified Brucella]MRN42066.1 amino acid-binding ACT domain-containing protein [Brucella sp. 09RB8913]MRN58412.1 amino acid-binding ACT domain-containing protein [Brucella sp. 09RB8918]CAB4325623.1 protein YdjB [Brucella sp. 191011898]